MAYAGLASPVDYSAHGASLTARREAIAKSFVKAVEAKRVKYFWRGTTNSYMPHEVGHPVTEIDCFHAANKMHLHYLKVTEERRKAGKVTY